MRLLLDTNRLTDALRLDDAVTQLIEEAEEVFVPFISLGEIQAGFEGGNPRSRPQNEARLLAFLKMPGVVCLYADRETTAIYARLFVQLRQAGTPVPTNDLWIASLAIQHQLTLATRDLHFAKIPQVSRI
jgi:tRNA(fMet)-specific endonuclease VapC